MYDPEIEEWRHIKDFPHYIVSTHGRVRHVDRPETDRQIAYNAQGFPIVTLYGADSKTRYLRHINKLVATEFLPTPMWNNETSVWHIDGDFKNCHVNNLKWETRARVLEWNNMHRRGKPSYVTPRVKNNRTGIVYANAYECAVAEGQLESTIIFKVERQARSTEDDNARYRYIFEGTYME